MGFSCGIVGLPNVGKSTLFSALTSMSVPAENYDFCTIEPNRGVVPVPDPRLERVATLFSPEKTTPTTLEFLDIAGLVKGASQGEGLGNRFLAHIREVDAIVHVLRCFPDSDVTHRYGDIDPVRDLQLVETELILRDLETIEPRLHDANKARTSGDKLAKKLYPALQRAHDALAAGVPLSRAELGPNDLGNLSYLFLLTPKPAMVVANLGDEQDEDGAILRRVREAAAAMGAPVVPLRARLQAEIAELDPEEQEMFREEMGIEVSGLEKLIQAGYGLLDLVTFYTTVGVEVRAWTVPAGTPAARAAGRIHTDMEKGFIRAEVIASEALLEHGSDATARATGAVRSEGRDYAVREGDVIKFLFRS